MSATNHRREILSSLVTGVSVMAVMVLAQWLDAEDRKHEAEQLRAVAVREGFQDGLDRIQCLGGFRYDAASRRFVDVK